MDDGKIIDMFFARNEDAIRHTDAAYGRRLYHLADRIVENGQDAEESVSDTYLKAWNTIPPKPAGTAPRTPGSWDSFWTHSSEP